MGGKIKKLDEVKKHIATIHTSGELSFAERKLVNVLLLNAFDDLLTKDVHTIPVKLLLPMMGWRDSKNWDDLKKCLSRLVTTEIKFDLLSESGVRFSTTSFLASGDIESGICSYEYSKFLANKMANPDVYAMISINMQKKFSSVYTLNLYENCKRFRNVKSTGFKDVALWRELLGATAPMYDDFRHFSNHVIKKAVNEINKLSDIHLTVEYQRHMRKVAQIRFIVDDNPDNATFELPQDDQESKLKECRETRSYKRLSAHGIGDKLALAMVLEEGDEYINQLIDYVEVRDKKGQIRGSKAGYIRTLVESKAKVGESEHDKVKRTERDSENAKINTIAPEEEKKQKEFKGALKKLSKEDRMKFAQEYFGTEGIGREKYFNPETVEFQKGEPNLHFTAWLRTRLTKPE